MNELARMGGRLCAGLVLAATALGQSTAPGMDIWTTASQGKLEVIQKHVAAGTNINATFVRGDRRGAAGERPGQHCHVAAAYRQDVHPTADGALGGRPTAPQSCANGVSE